MREEVRPDKPERGRDEGKDGVYAEVARMLSALRREARLTQKELAERVNTTQSAISRLEDESYRGHSLSMLDRIAGALGHRLKVRMVDATGGATRQRKPVLSLGEHRAVMKLSVEERRKILEYRLRVSSLSNGTAVTKG